MSDESVGKVPISSVEQVDSTKSKSTDEVDVIEEDTHFLFNAQEESEENEIQGNLLQELHPQSFSIDEQSDDLRKLLSKDISETDFTYKGKSGYIAVENITFSESSDRSNIREFTISGKFLPWPKSFTRSKPKSFIFITAENVDAKTDLSGSIFIEIPLNVLLFSDLDKSGNIQVKVSALGSTKYSLNMTSDDSFYSENYGFDYFSANPKLNVYLSNSGKLNSELIFSNRDLSSLVSLDGFSSNQFLSSAVLSSLVSVSSPLLFNLDNGGNLSKNYYLDTSFSLKSSLSGSYYLKNYLNTFVLLSSLLSSDLSTLVGSSSTFLAEGDVSGNIILRLLYGDDYGNNYASP